MYVVIIMKKKIIDRIFALLMIASVIVIMALSLFFVPYDISHDQHMVDTINERALEYEHPEGVITDFTEAEIMQLDAQEEYENKVWKLDHQELYWYGGIARGILISLAIAFLIYVVKGTVMDAIFDDEDYEDDIDFEFEDETEEPTESGEPAEPEKEVENVPVEESEDRVEP